MTVGARLSYDASSTTRFESARRRSRRIGIGAKLHKVYELFRRARARLKKLPRARELLRLKITCIRERNMRTTFGSVSRTRDFPGTEPSGTRNTGTEAAEHNRETVARERSSKQPRSPGKIGSGRKATTAAGKHSESDATHRELIIPSRRELARIPREQDLRLLDPVSLYECKVEAILLMQRILPRYATVESTRDKIGEKSAERNQDDVFLGIEIDLLIEVLRER